MDFAGTVEQIHVVTTKGVWPDARETVTAVAGKGLVGDVYYGLIKDGEPRPEKAVTLIAAEELEAAAERGLVLADGETRRNLTVRGVPLNDLIGTRFQIGGVLVEGSELCQPCAYLEKMTGKPVLKELMHKAGLRAYIIEGGEIAVGDAVSPVG